MQIKIANELVLKTEHEIIRVNDNVKMFHKDGRPIRGKLTEIVDEMIYVNQTCYTEIMHIGQIEAGSLYKCEV